MKILLLPQTLSKSKLGGKHERFWQQYSVLARNIEDCDYEKQFSRYKIKIGLKIALFLLKNICFYSTIVIKIK